jgi:hypothetical protein
MLGQTLLERRRQLVLDGIGAGALGAAVKMRAHLALGGERQTATLVFEEPLPRVLAGHRA